jgi:hypothetical protein
MHDSRPKLLKLLTDPQIGKIVVEHRDRLTRFGFISIEQLFDMQGRSLEVMFPSDTEHDLVDDFFAVMTSMASRIYGRRHSKERAEKIKQCVEQVMKQEAPMDRGHSDCTVDADCDIRELQQEAERNGSILDWTFDQEKNDFENFCNKMTSEEWKQYLEWEKEEEE